MYDEVLTKIQGVRDLRIQGRYADAASELEGSINSMGLDDRLTVELSETLFNQGFFRRVIEVLDKHLTLTGSDDNPNYAAGQMIRFLADFFMTGHFRESMILAESLYNCFISGLQSEVVDDATIRIDIYYCKFRHLAAACGSFDDSQQEGQLLFRLRKAFYVLIERSDFFNASMVARTHSSCCSGPEKTSLIEYLVDNKQIQPIQRAHAQLSLAKSIKSSERRDEQDRLYTSALELFVAGNHLHGGLDTKISMACRLPFSPEDGNFEERLTRYFREYETLNYPTGLESALLQLLETTHNLGDFKMEALILNDLEKLFRTSGSELNWLMARFSSLARQSLRGGDRGKTIQGGEALWNALRRTDCVFHRGRTAQLVSQAYYAIQDQDMTLFWHQRALEDMPLIEPIINSSITMGSNLASIEDFEKHYEKIAALLNSKETDHLSKHTAERIEGLLSQMLARVNRDGRVLAIIDNAIKLYEGHLCCVKDPSFANMQTASISGLQATALIMRASSRQDIDDEMLAIKHSKKARDLYLKEKQLGNAIMALQREALINVGIAQKFEQIKDDQVSLAWHNALRQYSVALDSANGLGLTFLARENAYWVAFCEYRRWIHGWCSSESLLQSLLEAEGYVDRQRQEVSILRGINAAVAKARLSSDVKTRNIYLFAIRVCTGVGNVVTAWSWVQKSKARSLSDLLGLGVLIPLELEERISRDKDCQMLFEDERRIMEKLAVTSDTDRFKVVIELEEHQKEMRGQAVLSELLDLREGVPIAIDELSAGERKAQHKKATIFVDWVATESGLSIYVVNESGNPIIRQLPISIGMIEGWVSEYLNGERGAKHITPGERTLSGMQEEDEPDEGPLRNLDVLISPLAELSGPDDLLVLCPTGPIHAVPLHALRLGPPEDRQILIERNPVVYCASLTSFIQCCRLADSIFAANVRKCLMAVYEEDFGPEDYDGKNFSEYERSQIYDSTKQIAADLHGEALCGESVTMRRLKEALERADLVHFFGHYDYTPELVVEQSLRISGEQQIAGEPQSASMAVKDVFNIRVKSSHVSLLACASATQHFRAGDEPLGLITALLAAGATSVLGTLWPVQSSAARLFSVHFYHALLRSAPKEHGMYDLAYAVREAVLEVKQCWEFRQPYYWAPFSLGLIAFDKKRPGHKVDVVHSSPDPSVVVGLTLSTSPSTLSSTLTEPFHIIVSARILSTPHPDKPITLQTHPSPLEGLDNRSFHNIICTANPDKKIEIFPRGWPQYHWDPEDLRSVWSFVTIPPRGKGTYTAHLEVPCHRIEATHVQKGERYRVNMTNKCLGTRWWSFASLAELDGVRLRSWRSQEDENDPETREEMDREQKERYGVGPATMGEGRIC
ncbi:MAG: hypothetical protein Q9165_000347 [Trypethelium subeluteriae]